MPQRKQPKSLVDLSIFESLQVIFKLCVQIESRWGDYNQPQTRAQVQTLQNYLLETVPSSLMDILYERRTQSLEYELSDHRILLSVFLHRNLRSLSSLTASLRQISQDNFWLETLPNLKNLVELDFKLMCTDEILKVVGENCMKLEFMNCISKISTVDRNLNFNALRLQLFVSDEGLQYLSRCKKLKKVTMNRKINSLCGGKKPTVNGIRTLVRSLPALHCLTFDDLGSVISTGMENCGPLSLLQLSDTHPTPEHMQEISRLCPNLKEMLLIRPSTADNDNLSNPVDNETLYSSDVLTALSETNLRLELLGLENFPFDENLVNYLSVKGYFLTSLQLYTRHEQITSQEILMIGEACPNLVGLHLQCLTAEKARGSFNYLRKSRFIFQNLSCISLGGNNWDPCIILPMCIIHAHNLARISLYNRGSEIPLDDVFTELMKLHGFLKVKVLHLLKGCHISYETLRSFVFHCPCLSVVKITQTNNNLTRANVDLFVKELSSLNYDVIVDVF